MTDALVAKHGHKQYHSGFNPVIDHQLVINFLQAELGWFEQFVNKQLYMQQKTQYYWEGL